MIESLITNLFFWFLFAINLIIFLRIFKSKFLTPHFILSFFFAQSFAVLIVEFNSITLVAINAFVMIFSFIIGYLSKSLNHFSNQNYHKHLLFNLNSCSYLLPKFIFAILAFQLFNIVDNDNILANLLIAENEAALSRKSDKLNLILNFATPSLIALLISFSEIKALSKFFIIFIFSFNSILSGSKAGFSVLALMYFAHLYWQNRSISRRNSTLLISLLVIGPLIVFILSPERFGLVYVDDISLIEMLSDFIYKIGYRILANNDQIELLIHSQLSIYDYPFWGPFQLMDPLIKLSGLRFLGFDYSPGEWLYGVNFGDWSGVGPNPTFIIEFSQALGPFAFIFTFALGRWFKFLNARKGENILFPIYILFPVIFFDFSLFLMKLLSYVLLLIILCMLNLVLNKHFFTPPPT